MDSAPLGAQPNDLLFLPLGGSGEIGMNLNLYFHAGKWLMVDLGVTFGNEEMPGVDIILPDPAYIEERVEDLVGLVLTHAHEDHLGAVPYLWSRLKCPIYATAFAASVLRGKLEDAGLLHRVELIEIPIDARFRVGPFDIELVTLTHSIPEPMALAIRTRAGLVLHTGDWKFDDTPLIGPRSDEAKLRRLSEEGVLALVGDSTNALRPGESGSESDVRAALTALIGRCAQRVVVACFASNIARLETIAHAAAANGRQTALVGRSLWRMDKAGRETGYLKDTPPFVSEDEAGFFPRERIVMICTGSQGEARAALARIAADTHPHVTLEAGDTAIFSSRMIPGNERAILRLHNALAAQGIEIITGEEPPAGLPGPIHVSGHPNQGELARMYQLVRPRIAIPVHGETRHMQAHAALARSCQVPHALVPANGDLVRLSREGASVIDRVPSGRLGVDGDRLIDLEGSVMRGRQRMLWNGAVVATVVIDRKGRLRSAPRIAAPGLLDPDSDADLVGEIEAAIHKALAKELRGGDDEVEKSAASVIKRVIKARLGKRPGVDVHLVRV
jgi:ribonuclease J